MAADILNRMKHRVLSAAGFIRDACIRRRQTLPLAEAGQSLAIYAVILTLVAVVSVGAVRTLNDNVSHKMDLAEDRISNRSPESEYEYIHVEALRSITASSQDYSGEYDGDSHTGSVVVTAPLSGYAISYGTENGSYTSGTPPRYTDAGNHTVYFRITASGYTPYYGSYSVSISRKAVPVPTVSADLTFNGSPQSPTISGLNASYISTSGTSSATAAGSYTITFALRSTNYQWSDGTSSEKSIAWSIGKCSLSNATIASVAAQSYTGSAITPTPAVTCNTITLVSGTDFTYSYNNNTTVGTATITITAVSSGNYTGSKNTTFTITAMPMTVRVSNYSGTYDGYAHTGSVSVTVPASGYTVKYGSSNGSYTSTSPVYRTDAGTTTVYYQVTADNYTTQTGSFTITIAKARISTVPSANDCNYTGGYVYPVWNNYNSTQLSISGTTRAYNVGSYTAYFTPTSNYMWSDGTTAAKSSTWRIISSTGTTYHTAVLFGRDRTLTNYMTVTYNIREDWNKATNSSTVYVTSILFHYYGSNGSDLAATNAYARTTGGAGGSDGHASWFAGSSSIMECNGSSAVIAFVPAADTSWIILFNNSATGYLYSNSGNTLASSEGLSIAHDSDGNAELTVSGYWSWGTINASAAYPRDTRGGISSGNLSYATTTVTLSNTK